MEAEGDTRGSVVALREVRECMEAFGDMLARVEALKATGSGKIVVEVIGVDLNGIAAGLRQNLALCPSP